MQRRALLAATGSAVLALSGCITASDGSNGTPDDDGNTSPTGTETPGNASPTETETPPSDRQEGDAAGASFADVACPSFADSADETVCTHTRGDDAPVYLTLSTEVFTPTTGDDSVETMAITLHNDSDSQFGLNPHAWAIKERTEGGWAHVAPREYVEPWHTVEAGGTYTYTLGVEPQPPSQERTHSITEDLSSGTYAFQITGLLDEGGEPDPSSDEGADTQFECIGLFTVSR